MSKTSPILITALFIFSAVFVSAGCNPRKTPAHTITPTLPTRTPASTRTPAPTITLLPSETPLPPPTIEPTHTPFPTPEVDFSSAKFYTAGFLPDWRFFIAIQAEGEMKGDYTALVDKTVTYKCEILAAYPKRLYCSGPLRRMNDWVNYAIYQTGASQPVFQSKVFIPPIDSLNRYLR
ncbi:MAG: hypothetical protein IT308_11460 [Anaerolineaceae bacterium]|nr:hypothetical protein [Anaerolineaceae bacterium]